MKTKKAIDIIQSQIIKLDNTDNHSWVLETRTYLKEFFGDESAQQRELHYFSFEREPNGKSLLEKVSYIEHFLKDCINTIDNIGVFKPKKENFLYELPNWLISIIVSAIIALCILVSTYFSTNNNIRLENENKILKDSISFIRKSISQPKHKDSIK